MQLHNIIKNGKQYKTSDLYIDWLSIQRNSTRYLEGTMPFREAFLQSLKAHNYHAYARIYEKVLKMYKTALQQKNKEMLKRIVNDIYDDLICAPDQSGILIERKYFI